MDLSPWGDFFIAQVGASAALLGLLFVGISLNLNRILSIRFLPDRAVVGMTLLFAILLTASLNLIPGQPAWAIGLEVLSVGLVVLVAGTLLQIRAVRSGAGERRLILVSNLVLFEIATVPYVIAGGLLLAGRPIGLYWIAAAILLSLVKAISDAWVLLVEINR